MTTPQVTVVIPTRERSDVLAACLRTVKRQRYANLKVVVSDNASSDETRSVVDAANDSRILYVNTGERVSMSHNWEFALSKVDGGWVMFIGDDDGLTPDAIVSAVGLIERTKVKAILTRSCTYNWPNDGWARYGHLIAPSGNSLTIRNSRRWLARVMSGACSYRNLPLIYNGGLVDMSILQEIKARTGSFFSSCNPDIYSGIAIASLTDYFAYSEIPLTISGISRHSTGTSFFSKRPHDNALPSKVFSEEPNIPFHAAVPLSESGGYPISLHAHTYESYLQSAALRAPERSQHFEQLAIILGLADTRESIIQGWGKRFANMHGLDFAKALAVAKRKRPTLRTQLFIRKFVDALRSKSAGSEGVPLLDVADASVAVALLRSPPRALSTLRREVARVRAERPY
ncbi:MAG: glycosyltransferase family 2 protein [Dokdonella sp.]|uniref:glycosyltransferase family 2 protein n=1 Tax=Dokdonella sp. TaxID=2291710 RepID=UPI003262D339